MNVYAGFAAFMGTAVEFIEALTIVLAVGVVRGWKSSLYGMFAAVAVLAVLVAIFGVPLMHLMNVGAFQLIIGLFMLLFGIRWLRKAILRYSGLKALHQEDQAYEEELARQRSQPADDSGAIDAFGFATSFNGVFLEGMESIFIVLTFGATAHAIPSAVIGSLIALALVAGLGIGLRKPLAKVPENTMKFVVGLMLTAFGVFWVGEGAGVDWWRSDLSVPVILAVLLVVSLISAGALKSGYAKAKRRSMNSGGGTAA